MDKISRILPSPSRANSTSTELERRAGLQSGGKFGAGEFESQLKRAALPSSIDRAIQEHRQQRDLRGWKAKEAANAEIAANVAKDFFGKKEVVSQGTVAAVLAAPLRTSSLTRAQEDEILNSIALDDSVLTGPLYGDEAFDRNAADSFDMNDMGILSDMSDINDISDINEMSDMRDMNDINVRDSGMSVPEEFRYYPKGSLIDYQA